MAGGGKNTLEVSAGRKVCVFVCVEAEKTDRDCNTNISQKCACFKSSVWWCGGGVGVPGCV